MRLKNYTPPPPNLQAHLNAVQSARQAQQKAASADVKAPLPKPALSNVATKPQAKSAEAGKSVTTSEETLESASNIQYPLSVDPLPSSPEPMPSEPKLVKNLMAALKVVNSLEEVSQGERLAVLQAIKRRIAEASSASTDVPTQSISKAEEPDRLPQLPAGLKWPTETYSEACKVRAINIVQFLEDPNGWLPLIQGRHVDLKTLRLVDPSAASAVNSYTKPNRRTGERRQLPSHLDIPTIKESHDRQITAAGGVKPALVANPGLASVIAGRLKRGTNIPGF